ncbi:Hypothetical protein R9X50_00384400 [Acrodontium crateriforme]|uniref:GPI anchored protein n=1 Tax=Acrodontium crateriforme TaxID=150365 RepID=A0AAQ3M510_9PEZI|nr:Hypothetical protein R9X50_00384400 [Acrodontium crateriforme]
MMHISKLLSLPTTLLAFAFALASEAATQDIDRDATTLRYVDHELGQEQYRRDEDETATWDPPMELRKMSNDEGEKFFPHYWNFGQSVQNSSHAYEFRPPIARHFNHVDGLSKSSGHSVFVRDYKCPTGTSACSSLGSDLCCPDQTNCIATKDGVGCCPGNNCGDTVGKCDESAGYTSCPNQLNGGCCIPGAVCQEAGCVIYGTQTVTVSGVVRTVTAGESFSTASGASGTTTSATSVTSNSAYTTTVTVTQSLSGQMTTIVSTLVSATTIIVGSSSSASATASAPVQPTSVSSSETSVSAATVTSQSTQISSESCPTGFYMCSAYYLGGCCRVGRNCDTTSCPQTDSTAVEVSGATVFVPVSASTTTGSTAGAETTGACATGWGLCAASVGGGCCPSNFICGTASCTAQASGEGNTAKEAASTASVLRWTWSFFALALGTGLSMVAL